MFCERITMAYRRYINGYTNHYEHPFCASKRNVVVASLLDNMLPARSRSSPAMMDCQPGPRTSTRRAADHPRPQKIVTVIYAK